ncbi:MAG: membrane protein insertion efficiency factor YidD [Deltaproteobacteria bacterium]|nr:membrane protein insertion efficiency factor YidD [Deltaproteobacteria bacterium]
MSTAEQAPTRPEGAVERLYAWYHDRVTPKDGPRCPFYPTCSAYALEAWRIHGPVGGVILAVDRLLREYPWMSRDRFYPVVSPHGAPRFHDPVPR